VNCDEHWEWKYTKDHHDWSAKFEIHAEMNAIVWAARQWIAIEWGTMYVMCEPCFQCTKNIVASGIKRVVFSNSFPHTETEEARKFLADNNVTIEQVDLWEEYRFQKTIGKDY
jgi:dCMP deaminase